MKVIGLIGGMSWESSAIYYQLINKRVKEKLGGHHSAECVMYSVDFQQIKDLQYAGKWEEATEIMIQAAQRIEKADADFLVICTNTMHKMAEDVQKNINIPLLHIADATAEKIQEDSIKTVGLLATNFTMEQDFYKGRLREFGLEVLVPPAEERKIVHDIIYHELCLGQVKEESKKKYLAIIDGFVQRGAEGVILGCTEITMLVNPEDVSVPVYDTIKIHALKAADLSISG